MIISKHYLDRRWCVNIKRSKCIFMFLAMLVVAGCSTASEIKDLDALVKETVLSERQENATFVCENGMVRADFNLRRMGRSDEVIERYDWEYEFCYGNSENYLNIRVPLDQYYIKVPNDMFREPVCTGGPATIGFEVYSLLGSGIEEEDNVYIKVQRSCGSAGCSHDITIRVGGLESMCFDPFSE